MKFKILFLGFVLLCGWSMTSQTYMKVQAKNFKEALSSSASVVNCSGCDLRGVQNLVGVDAHGVQLTLATFQPCVPSDQNKTNYNMVCVSNQISKLAGINFANAILYAANLDYADLKKANLSGVDFSYGSAQHADLTGANVSDMITKQAVFCNTTMPDGQICTQSLGVWQGQGVTIHCNCQAKTS